MPIVLRLDRVMADRKMSLNALAEKVGIANVNLSKIKTGKVSAIRFSTLEAICEALETYKQDQVAFYGNYAEFAQAQTNVQNAVISGRDDVVIMGIASNECTADLGDAVNAALAG